MKSTSPPTDRPANRNGRHVDVLSRFQNVTGGDKGQYEALCPVHDDANNSLAIKVMDEKILIYCHAECEVDSILRAVGLSKSDLFFSNGKPNSQKKKSRIVATYDYRDERGELLFQVVRFDPKDFRQRRPDVNGEWTWSVKGARVVPYRLPELLANPSRMVVLAEGEKDVDNLAGIDIVSTCNAGGAGKWKAVHAEHLRGRDVAILADNDDPGIKHAHQVAASLRGVAKSVRVVTLPGLPPKGDVSDWLAAGGTKAELAKLIQAVPEWAPITANGNGQHVAAVAPSKPTSAATKYRSVAPETMLRCGDRGNFGTVVADNGNSCLVHFEGENGTADKELPKEELSLMDGTPLAETAANSVIKPVQASTLLCAYPHLREIIVDGIARCGETVNIVSITKIGKSWLAYLLILAIATGQKWLGTFETKQGRCLLIDNELHVETLSRRLDTVAKEMGIPAYEWGDQIDIVSLRGKMVDLNSLAPTILAIKPGTYACVVADAWYRFFPPGVDENSNAQVMQLYNQIDQYADHLQAVWVNIHHASKGDQSGKGVTDVGSGAGSQSRAADSHLILRPHTEDNVVVLEAAVRSFPPVDPIAIRWSYPCWSLAEDVDESQLRRPASPQDQRQKAKDAEGIAKIVAALAGGELLTCRQLRIKSGLSRERLDRLLHVLESESRIASQETDVRGKPTLVYELKKIERDFSDEDDENELF